MNNLIILLLILCLICVVFIATQIISIKKSVNNDNLQRVVRDYHKYCEVYKKACAILKIGPEEGLSIEEMQKVINQAIKND